MSRNDTITTLYLVAMGCIVACCLIIVEQRGYERGLREARPDSILVVDTLVARPDSVLCETWRVFNE